MFVEIQTHGFTAQSFGFKGRLLNHIVGLLPKQIIAIIHDLMLNCLPVVTYVVLYQILSRNDENRDNLALITLYLGSHFYQ